MAGDENINKGEDYLHGICSHLKTIAEWLEPIADHLRSINNPSCPECRSNHLERSVSTAVVGPANSEVTLMCTYCGWQVKFNMFKPIEDNYIGAEIVERKSNR